MANSERTKVLLVDDHSLIAELIKKYLPLEGDFDISLAKDLSEAMTQIADAGNFDVVLLDVLLPERLSVDQISKIVSANQTGNVVLFSGNVTEEFVQKCLSIGVLGFIPKTLSLRSLASLISLVASGEPFVPVGYFTMTSNLSPENNFGLNQGEVEILEKLGQGLSNKEIMALLDLPESTVKMRVRSLSKKLGAKNRTHAVIVAREAGLL